MNIFENQQVHIPQMSRHTNLRQN